MRGLRPVAAVSSLPYLDGLHPPHVLLPLRVQLIPPARVAVLVEELGADLQGVRTPLRDTDRQKGRGPDAELASESKGPGTESQSRGRRAQSNVTVQGGGPDGHDGQGLGVGVGLGWGLTLDLSSIQDGNLLRARSISARCSVLLCCRTS